MSHVLLENCLYFHKLNGQIFLLEMKFFAFILDLLNYYIYYLRNISFLPLQIHVLYCVAPGLLY